MTHKVFSYASQFWVDGSPADSVPLSDRGLHYGDGIFETLRVVDGEIPLLSHHWHRLTLSCQKLGLPFDEPVLRQQLIKFIEHRGSGTAKIMITRGSGGRGYNPAGAKGRSILGWFPEVSLPDDRSRHGLSVTFCDTVLGHSPVLAGMKHLNRLEQVLARAELHNTQYCEGVMRDIDGWVIEGTMSNLFLVESGRIVTPDLSLCGVDGVLRQWLIKNSSVADTVTIEKITRSRLLTADEVFVGNSVMGVVPVIHCEDVQWLPGPVSRRVQQEVFQLFHVDG